MMFFKVLAFLFVFCAITVASQLKMVSNSAKPVRTKGKFAMVVFYSSPDRGRPVEFLPLDRVKEHYFDDSRIVFEHREVKPYKKARLALNLASSPTYKLYLPNGEEKTFSGVPKKSQDLVEFRNQHMIEWEVTAALQPTRL